MNYELAKQLKEAGFPQNLDGNKCLNGSPLKHYDKEGEPYCPTLSELIEACGEELFTLSNIGRDGHKWEASTINELCTRGSTPEEAVAKLWLEVNEK